MTTDEAIKISLSYQTCEAALECLLDALRATDLDELSEDGQGDIFWMKEYLKDAEKSIGVIDKEVKKIEKLFDAWDEDEILSVVCAIQKRLNAKGTPPLIMNFHNIETVAKATGL